MGTVSCWEVKNTHYFADVGGVNLGYGAHGLLTTEQFNGGIEQATLCRHVNWKVTEVDGQIVNQTDINDKPYNELIYYTSGCDEHHPEYIGKCAVSYESLEQIQSTPLYQGTVTVPASPPLDRRRLDEETACDMQFVHQCTDGSCCDGCSPLCYLLPTSYESACEGIHPGFSIPVPIYYGLSFGGYLSTTSMEILWTLLVVLCLVCMCGVTKKCIKKCMRRKQGMVRLKQVEVFDAYDSDQDHEEIVAFKE
eukprot:354433_1